MLHCCLMKLTPDRKNDSCSIFCGENVSDCPQNTTRAHKQKSLQERTAETWLHYWLSIGELYFDQGWQKYKT